MFCVVKQSPLLHVRLRKQLLTIAKLGSVSLTPEHTSHRRSLFKEQNRTSRRSSSTPGRFFNVQLREMASSSEAEKKTNRLANEKSPYLLQHATNPVDWYPWGNEAFEKAKRENKPIFLSVGYSTCHWCHVMERESFESDEVAAILNNNYVSIKVDREERPDVDRIYMAFVQRTTGGGGWPMSVFMTPDLSPLYGGTYFPPEDEFGRVGFKNLLRMISKQWQKQHNILQKEANDSVVQLKQLVTKKYSKGAKIPSRESWMKCFQQLSKSYDSKHGGFSSAPKFPQPTMFNFLFHFYSKNKTSAEGSKAKSMCLHTLEKMAYGGIHDHVNCGFARYSVDEKWHLPHFEKMLYDQAQLAVAYVDAYVVSKNTFFAEVVDDILTYVGRDLGHKEGGFYGAEDADSYPSNGSTHGKLEGAFCVWEFDELKTLLTGNTNEVSHFDLYTSHFNVNPDGNVRPEYDRHGELLKKNVLSCFGSYDDTAREFNISVDEVKEILKHCHKILYDKRQSRPKPHVDTKIVTSWNGMMISGYAKAGFALNNSDYTARAITAANFIKNNLYSGEVLLRCCYGEQENIVQTEIPIEAFLDDFVCLIRGLLDLYEATLDTSWLEWAEKLQGQQDAKFWDSLNYGYFSTSSNDSTLIVRDKDDQDGAEPCGNSVAVHNLVRLSGYLDRKDLREKAGKILSSYSERLNVIPVALPEMTSALMLYHTVPTQVFIAGKTENTNTQALIDVVRNRYMPSKILAVADGPEGKAALLYARHAHLKKLKPIQGKSAAYVCRNFACTMPVTDPDSLATSLDSDMKKMRRGSGSDSDSDSD